MPSGSGRLAILHTAGCCVMHRHNKAVAFTNITILILRWHVFLRTAVSADLNTACWFAGKDVWQFLLWNANFQCLTMYHNGFWDNNVFRVQNVLCMKNNARQSVFYYLLKKAFIVFCKWTNLLPAQPLARLHVSLQATPEQDVIVPAN